MHPYPYPPCESFGCDSRECCGRGYKFTWPNVVGMTKDEAIAIIVRDNPLVTIVLRSEGHRWRILDFCCNRVWLDIDANNRVCLEPEVG
ncbi:hypothetical protein CASFOL_012965 [Castilleja foliolosa]|uniref:Proteinase inhibitor n=1 Tax=Castilleja foliolosa TaxID=1961234 RepID=A0ABD3DIK8_9LAMI